MTNRFNSVSFGTGPDPTNGTLEILGKSVGATNLQANASVVTDASGLLDTVPAANHQVGGANTQVQYNDNGVFAGASGLTYTKGTDTVGIHRLTVTDAGATLTIGCTAFTTELSPSTGLRINPGGGLELSPGASLIITASAESTTTTLGRTINVGTTLTENVTENAVRTSTTGNNELNATLGTVRLLASAGAVDIDGNTVTIDATSGTLTLASNFGQELKFDSDGDLLMTGTAAWNTEVDGKALLTSISDDVVMTAQSGRAVVDASDHVVRANPWRQQGASTNFGTTASPNPTVAQLLTGILRGAATTNGRWTLPTAATVVAQALTDGFVDDAFTFVVINEGTAYDILVVGNTGVTLRGDMTVPPQSSAQFRLRLTNVTASTEAYTVYRISDSGRLPTRYVEGFQLDDSKASAKTVLAGVCRDDTDTFDIRRDTNMSVALTTPGAGGLDNGVEAANTWYYVYVIADPGGTNAVTTLASTSPTSPVMPRPISSTSGARTRVVIGGIGGTRTGRWAMS